MACEKFRGASIGFGASCTVCGYPETMHEANSMPPAGVDHGMVDTPRPNRQRKTIVYRNPESKSTNIKSKQIRTDKKSHSKKGRGGKELNDTSLTDVAKTRKLQQATLLTLAGDAARGDGDMRKAKELYEKSANMFGTLTLAETKNKIPLKTLLGSESGWSPSNVNEAETERSSVAYSHRSDWSESAISERSYKGKDDRNAKLNETEKRWMNLTKSKHKATADTRGGNDLVKEGVEERLLRLAEFNDAIRTVLRRKFSEYAEGAPSMSPNQFAKLLQDFNCYGSPEAYFAAFDRSKHGSWLGVKDFELGMAALDTLTPASGEWRTERARYIFRFYTCGRKKMSLEVLAAVIEDLQYVSGTHNEESAAVEADRLNKQGSGLLEAQFVALIDTEKLRGTSRLFRFSFLEKISD